MGREKDIRSLVYNKHLDQPKPADVFIPLASKLQSFFKSIVHSLWKIEEQPQALFTDELSESSSLLTPHLETLILQEHKHLLASHSLLSQKIKEKSQKH